MASRVDALEVLMKDNVLWDLNTAGETSNYRVFTALYGRHCDTLHHLITPYTQLFVLALLRPQLKAKFS